MPKQSRIGDGEILEAALTGLQSELSRIEVAMSDIRRRLGERQPGRPPASADGAQPRRGRRRMSAAARKRIAEATRKRWAAFRAAKAGAAKPVKRKRKMSRAGRAAIVAATKKRWAEFRKKKTAAKQKGAAKKSAPRAEARKSALKTRKVRILAAIPPVAVPVMP